MNLEQFFSQNFPGARDQWEKTLKAELKLEDVSAKTQKKSPEGKWPTLSLDAPMARQLKGQEAWKKSAQTYIRLPADVTSALSDDIASGVRLFFFEKDFLSQDEWDKVARLLSSHEKAKEFVTILLGDREIGTSPVPFRIIDEKNMFRGRGAWAPGGTIVQELSQIALGLVDADIRSEVHLGVFIDSHFFRNIAKVRAAKLLAQKILSERKIPAKVFVTGLTSYRDWTLYERYSNMLRNDASVASGLIAGCDYVQSAGYQALFDLEVGTPSPEHDERSRRMARNTSHILSLESTLGLVEDASSGSYHLETLTEEFAREAWALMQKVLPLSAKEVSDFYMKETTPVREERMKNLATRRQVLAGVNDFPDVKDELKLKSLPVPRFFRTARPFEELRLRMEGATKPDVYLAIQGDYAALNARINFVKNYFELLGLTVIDPGHSVTEKEVAERKEKFLVLVAADEHYANMTGLKSAAVEKYLAGKTELDGYRNLFAGQNVYDVLSGIVGRWGKK